MAHYENAAEKNLSLRIKAQTEERTLLLNLFFVYLYLCYSCLNVCLLLFLTLLYIVRLKIHYELIDIVIHLNLFDRLAFLTWGYAGNALYAMI